MTRYHKKTKEVEPEIKEVTQRGEQLAGDCSREGQSLCLNRVKLGKNHRVSGGRGLSLECAEPRGKTRCPCRVRVGESTGRRLSACRAGQTAQKALSTGGKAWPVTEPLCAHGTVQHVGAGRAEAGTSALLSSPTRRGIPTKNKRTRTPACGRSRRPAPVQPWRCVTVACPLYPQDRGPLPLHCRPCVHPHRARLPGPGAPRFHSPLGAAAV